MAKKRRHRVGRAGKVAIGYIKANPGSSILQVDAGARTARGGHQWMYKTVHRLIKKGLVKASRGKGGKYILEISPEADEYV